MKTTCFASLLRKVSVTFFSFAILMLTNSPIAYACACCAEPGTWFHERLKADQDALALVGQVGRRFDKTARLYVDAAGLEEVKGISHASETYSLESFVSHSRNWRLEFKDSQGNHGTLAFTIPATAIFYGSDQQEGQPGGGGSPMLYKEWVFAGPVSGTGIFKRGTPAQTKFQLILQGRGNMCPAQEDFKSWILQVKGPRADFSFNGMIK